MVAESALLNEKPGARLGEMALAALGWAAFLGALLFFTQAYVGFERWFWLDEAITAMIARDPSPVHAFGSIADGVDSNLPGLYVMLGVLKAVGVPMTETALHIVSFAALWALLVGLYGILRMAFSPFVAVLAILPLLMMDVVIDQAYEIRCYMFWAAGSVWLAYGLAQLRLVRGRFSAWHVAVLGLTAFAASIHYFSLLTLGSILVCDWLADGRARNEKWLARWPVWPGLLPGLLAPWLYWHQRQMLSGSWMWAATLKDTGVFLYQALMLDKVAILAGVGVVVWLLRGRVRVLKAQVVKLGPLNLLAGLAGLAVLPLLLTVISWTIQPVLVTRYALAALPAVTILFGLLLYRLPRVVLASLLLLMVAEVGQSFRGVPTRSLGFMLSMSGLGIDVGTRAPAGPVVFEGRHDLYPILLYFTELQKRLYFLDFEANEDPPGTLPTADNFALFERDAQRGLVEHYPFVQSRAKSQLTEWNSFTFVPFSAAAYPYDAGRVAARFPGWDAYPIDGHMIFLRRRPVTAVSR